MLGHVSQQFVLGRHSAPRRWSNPLTQYRGSLTGTRASRSHIVFADVSAKIHMEKKLVDVMSRLDEFAGAAQPFEDR